MKTKAIKPKTHRTILVEFGKHFDTLCYRSDAYSIFDDFLDFALHYFNPGQSPDFIDVLKKRYPREEEFAVFPKMLESYMEAAKGDDGTGLVDPLGDFFMERLSRGHNGQFFTPIGICNLMAMITVVGAKDGQSVNDCACGSGRNLLAAARINRNLILFGEDLDIRCCKMTLLNLLVNNLQGRVRHQDTLRMEVFQSWAIINVQDQGKVVSKYYKEETNS